MIKYPNPDRIIEYNLLALTIIKVKKADQPKVLSRAKIIGVIEDMQKCTGDIYDKSEVLLKGIIQKHPFASGNRRTALIVTKEFLKNNGKILNIVDDPEHARTMLGIREGYYSDEEIKGWIKNGKIREFKR